MFGIVVWSVILQAASHCEWEGDHHCLFTFRAGIMVFSIQFNWDICLSMSSHASVMVWFGSTNWRCQFAKPALLERAQFNWSSFQWKVEMPYYELKCWEAFIFHFPLGEMWGWVLFKMFRCWCQYGNWVELAKTRPFWLPYTAQTARFVER